MAAMQLILTDIGIFSATLLWLAMVVKFTRRWMPATALLVVMAVALAVALLPFNNLVIGSYIFSLTSYLSVSSMLLLVAYLILSGAGDRCELLSSYWGSPGQWLPVYGFFVLSGVLLYPLAAGLTLFDPYRLGFAGSPASLILPLYLLAWAVICVLRAWTLLLLLLVCAVLAYYLKILPSLNLWDYVLDALLVIYSLFMLLKHLACRMFKVQRSNKQVY
ncbi:MAG: hypothetical protein V7745_05560 [Pseudomonadales bacterium]